MEFFIKIAAAFEEGGVWMWAIGLFQVVSIAIIVERSIFLFRNRKLNQMEFVNSFEDGIRRGEMEAVIKKAESSKGTHAVARALSAGATAAMNFGGKDEIQGKMDEVLLHENATLDKRIAFLSMLGNVATLTGLLGTITGMIKSFAAVAQANPTDKAALLSAGISEAMNATAYGLIVAIPALIAYAILQNRANSLAEDLNQGALKVFNWLSFSYDPVALRSTNAQGRTSSSNEKSQELNA